MEHVPDLNTKNGVNIGMKNMISDIKIVVPLIT